LVGDEFLRYYVCLNNNWNPYSKEILSIPQIYWVIAFHFIQVKKRYEWDNIHLPIAEMIGQLTHPEIYVEYNKIKEKKRRLKEAGPGGEFFEESRDGIQGGGTSNSHYDPERGLVDENGNVLISKEAYDDMVGIEGIALSY